MSKTDTFQVLFFGPMCIVMAPFLWFLFTPRCREAFCIIRRRTDPDRLMTFLFPRESSRGIVRQASVLQKQQQHPWVICLWKKMVKNARQWNIWTGVRFWAWEKNGLKLLHPTTASSSFPLFFFFFATINQSGMMARIKSWGKFKWKKNSKCVFHRELSGTCCSKWFQA